MEIIIFMFCWMLLDNILQIISKTWRREKIKELIKYDKEMENYWNYFWVDIKKLFK